jgi:tripartite ATP-independent transporter DctM subunit
MDAVTISILGIILLAVLLLSGVHIGVSLGVVGFLGTWMLLGFKQALYGSVNMFYDQVASYSLITVPLFIAMGYLASAGKLSQNIFNSLNHWIGRVRGGIGIATVGSCTLFGTICGSSLVTSSVFALTAAPEMRKQGYDKTLSYGICASSGIIGMLIPPSILMVVYGVLSGDSVGKLLVAGITPGLILGIFYSATILILAKIKPHLIEKREGSSLPLGQRMKELVHLWPVFVVIIVIFGGIFGGVFTPTEAGAIATFIVLVLLIILEKGKSIKPIIGALSDTARTSAMIYLIFGGSAIFSQFLVLSGLTGRFAEFIISMNLSKFAFMMIISLLYLVLGCLLESISMLSITIPLIYPILGPMGIDPIWYAVVVVVAIHIGMITPPVGLCVYGAKAVAEKDVSLEDVFKGVAPFFLVSLLALLILIFIPGLSTFLPNLVFPW